VYNNYISGIDDNKTGCAFALLDGTAAGVSPSYPQVKRAVICFNAFVDNKYAIGLGVNSNGGILKPDSCIFANNVALSTTSTPVITANVTSYDGTTNTKWFGNIFYNAAGGIGLTDTGITNVNPQLSVASDGLFRPGSSSPVINASKSPSSFPFVTDDMDGQPRNDGSPDVGADENSIAPKTRRPLTPADVGPPPGMITSVEELLHSEAILPQKLVLGQNYPNPFNPSTSIVFDLPAASHVVLKIYDQLGREVTTIVDGFQVAGRHHVQWNAARQASGFYFCRLQMESENETRKILLLR